MTCACGHEFDEHDDNGVECCVEDCDCIHYEASGDEARHWRDAFDAFDALRPPCPTCGGTHEVIGVVYGWKEGLRPCPDCPDGKVSIERLVDRLAELEEALEAQIAIGADLARVAFADLLPPCPTCDGQQLIDCGTCDGTAMIHPSVECGACSGEGYFGCPDCSDGKVSIEQLVATWRAVWDDAEKDKVPTPISIGRATIAAYDNGVDRAFDHLRSVKPSG